MATPLLPGGDHTLPSFSRGKAARMEVGRRAVRGMLHYLVRGAPRGRVGPRRSAFGRRGRSGYRIGLRMRQAGPAHPEQRRPWGHRALEPAPRPPDPGQGTLAPLVAAAAGLGPLRAAPIRQQPGQAGHPDAEGPAEGLRRFSEGRWDQRVLSPPALSVDAAQAGSTPACSRRSHFLRYSAHASIHG